MSLCVADGHTANPAALVGCVVALALAGPGPADVAAQEGRYSARPLETGHWSVEFVEMLHARGTAEAWPIWLEPLPAGVLEQAMAPGEGGSDSNAGISFWTDAFRAETALAPAQVARLGVAAGFESSQVSLVPERGGYLEGVVDVPFSPAVSAWVAGGLATEGSSEVFSGGLAARFGAGQLLVGRMSPKIGQGTARILLSGRNPMNGVLIGTARPAPVPVLGRVTAHFFVAPEIDTPQVDGVTFSSFGFSIEPHPAVTLGAYRTVRFGGDGVEGSGLGSLFPFQGGDDPAEDNQGELAARVRFRAWGQPAAVYATLGFEDPVSAWEDPGLIAGILLPFDLPQGMLTGRYEYQAFGESARWCGSCEAESHRWYRQREYGPYQIGAVPLASSLGGYGSRHQVEISYWGASRIRLSGVVFTETREEQNLLYERWPGSRTGMAVSAFARPRPGWEIGVRGAVSDTEAGAESGIDLVFRVFDVIRNPAGAPR